MAKYTGSNHSYSHMHIFHMSRFPRGACKTNKSTMGLRPSQENEEISDYFVSYENVSNMRQIICKQAWNFFAEVSTTSLIFFSPIILNQAFHSIAFFCLPININI